MEHVKVAKDTHLAQTDDLLLANDANLVKRPRAGIYCISVCLLLMLGNVVFYMYFYK